MIHSLLVPTPNIASSSNANLPIEQFSPIPERVKNILARLLHKLLDQQSVITAKEMVEIFTRLSQINGGKVRNTVLDATLLKLDKLTFSYKEIQTILGQLGIFLEEVDRTTIDTMLAILNSLNKKINGSSSMLSSAEKGTLTALLQSTRKAFITRSHTSEQFLAKTAR